MADTEKERATDLLEAADFCEEMARQLVITASHLETPGAILNAVDNANTQFIDIFLNVVTKPFKETLCSMVKENGLEYISHKILD